MPADNPILIHRVPIKHGATVFFLLNVPIGQISSFLFLYYPSLIRSDENELPSHLSVYFLKGGGAEATHDLFRGGVENEVVISRRAGRSTVHEAFYFMYGWRTIVQMGESVMAQEIHRNFGTL